MPPEIEILKDVSIRLDSLGIEYMLTGSFAMIYYAFPRMTRHIEIVIALKSEQAEKIVEAFSPDYYVTREAVSDSIIHSSMFNLIHNSTIVKADFIIRKQSPYHLNEFSRRMRIDAGGFGTNIVSKEDLVLAKLPWARDSLSEMQLRDIKNLLSSGVDGDYIQKWIAELDLKEVWTHTTHE